MRDNCPVKLLVYTIPHRPLALSPDRSLPERDQPQAGGCMPTHASPVPETTKKKQRTKLTRAIQQVNYNSQQIPILLCAQVIHCP